MQYNVTQTAFVVQHLGKTSLAQVNYKVIHYNFKFAILKHW